MSESVPMSQREIEREWRKRRLKALNDITSPCPIVNGAEIAHSHNYKTGMLTFSAWRNGDPVNRASLMIHMDNVLACKTRRTFIRRFYKDFTDLANPNFAAFES